MAHAFTKHAQSYARGSGPDVCRAMAFIWSNLTPIDREWAQVWQITHGLITHSMVTPSSATLSHQTSGSLTVT